MAEAHEDPRFTHAATYAVVITYTVAGGARPATAHRRAGKIAERLASAAARAADVVDARATAGPLGTDDEIVSPTTVRFAAANTGPGTYADPDNLSRYLDPDHERARASLVEANARYRARRETDQQRRSAVECRNLASAPAGLPRHVCGCVYCEPAFHLAVVRQELGPWVEPPRCPCGRPVANVGGRCRDHRNAQLIVLAGDPQSLHELAQFENRSEQGEEQR